MTNDKCLPANAFCVGLMTELIELKNSPKNKKSRSCVLLPQLRLIYLTISNLFVPAVIRSIRSSFGLHASILLTKTGT